MKFLPLFILLFAAARLAAQTVDAGPDTSVCAGQRLTLHATVSDTSIQVLFMWEPAEFFDDPNSASPVCTPTATHTFFVTAIFSNGATAIDSVRITVLPKPEPTFTVDDIICYDSPGAVTLTLDGTQAPFQLTVNDEPFGESVSPNIGIIAYTPGPYRIVIDNNFGCTDTLDVVVGGPPFPLQFRALSVSVFSERRRIRAVAFGGAGGHRFSLDDVNYQPTGRFDNLAPGAYTVHLRDANDCLVKADVRLD